MIWICTTCAVETADSATPPEICEIWVPASGQAWTTLAELEHRGTRTTWFEVEPEIYGVTADPEVGIGRPTTVVDTGDRVVVFDPLGYVDAAAVEHTRDLGAVRVVAASHPHMYGCQTAWAQALGAPVVISAG